MSDNDVGYGKPPRHAQFKKGSSENTRGRPKKKQIALLPRQLRKDILMMMEELLVVKTSNGIKKISGHEMVLRSIRSRAIEGNPTAIKQWMSMTTAAVNERLQLYPALQIVDEMMEKENREKLALHEFQNEKYDFFERTRHLY
ncbi:DUF5681 domain-containing protein [Novosphingobium sp.]|uniref:DUF5681 domain-containing protein n=1 Tax=Novosphingobium sp. TaxID=1874826 RepID=UPI003D0D00C8